MAAHVDRFGSAVGVRWLQITAFLDMHEHFEGLAPRPVGRVVFTRAALPVDSAPTKGVPR